MQQQYVLLIVVNLQMSRHKSFLFLSITFNRFRWRFYSWCYIADNSNRGTNRIRGGNGCVEGQNLLIVTTCDLAPFLPPNNFILFIPNYYSIFYLFVNQNYFYYVLLYNLQYYIYIYIYICIYIYIYIYIYKSNYLSYIYLRSSQTLPSISM